MRVLLVRVCLLHAVGLRETLALAFLIELLLLLLLGWFPLARVRRRGSLPYSCCERGPLHVRLSMTLVGDP